MTILTFVLGYGLGMITLLVGVFVGTLINRADKAGITCPQCGDICDVREHEGLIFRECKTHGKDVMAWKS